MKERETGLAMDHVATLGAVLTPRSITIALAFVQFAPLRCRFRETVEEGERGSQEEPE